MDDRFCVVYSSGDEPENSFGEVSAVIDSDGRKPLLIVFFARTTFFREYSVMLHEKYPDTEVIGSATPYVFGSDGAGTDGIYCLAVFDGIECAGGAIPEASRYPMKYVANVEEAVSKLSEYRNTVCMEFTTNTSFSEELVLDTLNSVLSDKKIRVFGASSGADTIKDETFVSYNGQIYSNGAVFVLIRNLRGRIYLYKENMYKSTNIELRATDVDCENRMVYEFNDKSTLELIGKDLGIPRDMAMDFMDEHPLGRVIDRDIYIVSAREITDEGIQFHGRIYNMMPMVVLEMENMENVWNRTARNIKDIVGIRPSFTIAINCAARRAAFIKRNLLNDFNKKLKDSYGEYIGITGFGEQLDGVHLNQTLVLALFE